MQREEHENERYHKENEEGDEIYKEEVWCCSARDSERPWDEHPHAQTHLASTTQERN